MRVGGVFGVRKSLDDLQEEFPRAPGVVLVAPIDFGEAIAEEGRVVVRPVFRERLFEHGLGGYRVVELVAVDMHDLTDRVGVVLLR